MRKSENPVKGYLQSVAGFLIWFDQSKVLNLANSSRKCPRVHFILKTDKDAKPKMINTKLNALVKVQINPVFFLSWTNEEIKPQ